MPPTLFIGSSSEGLEIARAAGAQLADTCEVTVWDQGVFGLSKGTLESLIQALDRFDFALLVLTPDDLVTSRDDSTLGPRDNVLFELGLFMGRLGPSRTFVLCDPSQTRLPSDLRGVTVAAFTSARQDGNMEAAIGPATYRIRNAIRDRGPFEGRAAKRLEQATEQIRGTSELMEKLIILLAKSRSTELEILSSQFGGLLRSDALQKMIGELEALQATTAEADRT